MSYWGKVFQRVATWRGVRLFSGRLVARVLTRDSAARPDRVLLSPRGDVLHAYGVGTGGDEHDPQSGPTATRQPVRGRPRAALLPPATTSDGRAPRGRAFARRAGRAGGRRAVPDAARRPSERAEADALGCMGREG